MPSLVLSSEEAGLLEGPYLATLAPSSHPWILCFPPHRESWHHATAGRFLVSHGGN